MGDSNQFFGCIMQRRSGSAAVQSVGTQLCDLAERYFPKQSILRLRKVESQRARNAAVRHALGCLFLLVIPRLASTSPAIEYGYKIDLRSQRMGAGKTVPCVWSRLASRHRNDRHQARKLD